MPTKKPAPVPPEVSLEHALRDASIAMRANGDPALRGVETRILTKTLEALMFYAARGTGLPPVPKPTGPLPAPDGYFWGSCTTEDAWDVGRSRHLVRIGGLDTRCGASASYPEVWAPGHPKKQCPKCIECLTEYEKRELNLTTPA